MKDLELKNGVCNDNIEECTNERHKKETKWICYEKTGKHVCIKTLWTRSLKIDFLHWNALIFYLVKSPLFSKMKSVGEYGRVWNF